MMEPCRQDMSMFYSSSNNIVSPTHSTSVRSLGRVPVNNTLQTKLIQNGESLHDKIDNHNYNLVIFNQFLHP